MLINKYKLIIIYLLEIIKYEIIIDYIFIGIIVFF